MTQLASPVPLLGLVFVRFLPYGACGGCNVDFISLVSFFQASLILSLTPESSEAPYHYRWLHPRDHIAPLRHLVRIFHCLLSNWNHSSRRRPCLRRLGKVNSNLLTTGPIEGALEYRTSIVTRKGKSICARMRNGVVGVWRAFVWERAGVLDLSILFPRVSHVRIVFEWVFLWHVPKIPIKFLNKI